MSFPNATSLSSHTTAHDKRERYRQLGATTLKENLRIRNQVPSNLIPDSPPTSPPKVNASSPSSLLERHLQIHLLFYHCTVKSMLIFPIQYLLNLFLQSNNPQDQATTYEIPHPDDPPPSHPYNLRFKEMLEADILPPWEDFSGLLDEFINFSKAKVKVKDPPVSTAPFSQQQVDDPKFI